jgi:ATP phosphoribosyltransferase regulatory subunit HisZ
MPELQPARGTQDLLPETMRRHRRVSDTARKLAALYGFAEIATPIFEFTEVFARPIGEHTDIVSKEMYTFTDRGGEEITLRPENTAGVVRAVLSNGLTQSTPLKFFYAGPMFRYERPQKGRFRQFHQIGVELLGVEGGPAGGELAGRGARVARRLRRVADLRRVAHALVRRTAESDPVVRRSGHRSPRRGRKNGPRGNGRSPTGAAATAKGFLADPRKPGLNDA